MTLPDRFESIAVDRLDELLGITAHPKGSGEDGAAEMAPGAFEGLRVA